MKISKSLSDLYTLQKVNAEALQKIYQPEFDTWAKARGWHYADRIKEAESYAQKIEQSHHRNIEDVYAGTVIVRNRLEVYECCELLEQKETCKSLQIIFVSKRPDDLQKATFRADCFAFDSVRMYFKAAKPDVGEPDYLAETFEIQIKTLTDEAWSKVSHDFFYKTDEDISWAKERLMAQIKALLESAEIAINEAATLSEAKILQKEDKNFTKVNAIMQFYREAWIEKGALPKDLRRLAENTKDLLSYLGIDVAEIREIIQQATEQGCGANVIHLAPYWIVVLSIAQHMGWERFLSKINNKLSWINKKRERKKVFPLLRELKWPENINLEQYSEIREI